MRTLLIAALATATLAGTPSMASPSGTVGVAGTGKAQQGKTLGTEPLAAYAQYRGRYYRGGSRYSGRGYYGHPGYYGRPYGGYYRHGYGYGYGGAAAAGIAGLATGAIIGGALAAQAQPAPTYVVPSDDGAAY